MTEPKGQLARYAFGYPNKKPDRYFWVPLILMVLYVLYKGVTIQ